MKATEIHRGMKVGITRGGRDRRIDARGVVIATRTHRDSYSGRSKTFADIQLYDRDWNPQFAGKWEDGKLVKTDEPLIRNFRIQQLISLSELNAREEADRQVQVEYERQQAMVKAVREGIESSLLRAGIEQDGFHVYAKYRPATDDEAEGVVIQSVTFQKEGVQQLQNFISREFELIDQEPA